MGDEVKPFAAIEEAEGLQRLVVGSIEVDNESDYEDGWSSAMSNVRRFRVGKINAAVEAREARLVAALRLAREALDFIGQCDLHAEHECARCAADEFEGSDVAGSLAFDRKWATDALKEVAEVLKSHGDYVPRAALEAERKKNSGLWEKLNDVLHEGGLASERAAEIMKALGMAVKPKPISPASWLSKATHAAVSQHNTALERVVRTTTAPFRSMRIEEHANGRGELRSVLVVDDRPHTSVWSRLVGDSFMTQTTRHEGDVPYPWVG